MSGSNSVIEVLGTTPRMGRRSMALADIDPKYVSQSGIWEASEVETSRGSIRIQHLTTTTGGSRPFPVSSGVGGAVAGSSRFAQLEDCAHFHYDIVDLPALKISIREDSSKGVGGLNAEESGGDCAFSIEVVSGGLFWSIRRTHANVEMLDDQLHCCVWDRSFSQLEKVKNCSEEQHDGCRRLVERYLARLSQLPTNQITCGTVLSWLELDNRGRHIVSSDDCAINTPAVAAACAKRKYTANAPDEISFEVGEMISVIDMPPPEESIWWRGKRGFHVGFFPRDYVQVIGDKVPMSLPIAPSTRRVQRLSVSSSSSTAPAKPVLRKHGKLIAFFRSFILSRPSRRRLKQTGILRERVFGCDLAEHLLNSGSEIPAVLKCCAEFIEMYGIVDGIYRLSGITSNIQKLRISFDEDKVPHLEEDEAIKSDIHAVSSLLKMYFRELPNPLCTYQLYEKFVVAAQAADKDRLFRMREVVHELPPPHYRTLEYLMKHLARVAEKSSDTGMTPKNMAIVWAPNLFSPNLIETDRETLISRLKGIGVQAVVTEYLVRHSDLIFRSELPPNLPPTTTLITSRTCDPDSGRPKSLSISSPIRLMSLEEAQDKAKDDRKFIEVGGGPSSLPPKYHTVIDLPSRRAALKTKRSPTGWRHFFSRNRSFSKPPRKISTPIEISIMKNLPGGMLNSGSSRGGRLRPVKSVESLVSSPNHPGMEGEDPKDLDNESVAEVDEGSFLSKSSPATPMTDVHVVFHHPPPTLSTPNSSLQNTKTHNRSISHDSYFEFGEFKTMNNVYIDETLEEETLSQSSKISLEDNSSGMESNVTSPKKCVNDYGVLKTENRNNNEGSLNGRKFNLKSPITPPPSAPPSAPPSVGPTRVPMGESLGTGMSTSSDDFMLICETSEKMFEKKAKALNKPPRPTKWRDSEVQTSCTKLFDVGVSTSDNDLRSLPGPVNSVREQKSHERRLSATSNPENGNYELDRNSSVDDSSNDSTPGGDLFSMTNIIYSPLVNEILSPPAEHNKKHSSSVSIEPSSSSMYICPLYEVGVGAEEFSLPMEPEDSSMRITEVSSLPSLQSLPHEYENVGESGQSPIMQSTVPRARTHVYANDHLYENTLVQDGVVMTGLSGGLLEVEKGGDVELYGGEHYENVSDGEVEPKLGGSESNYESNIYEDIDDESIVEKNNYETIEVSSLQSGTTSPHSKRLELLSDNEGESAYESVRFQRGALGPPHHYAEIQEKKRLEGQYANGNNGVGDGRVVLSGSSSPSYSNTEDVVTYLEVTTPGCKLNELKGETSMESSDDPFTNYESFDGSLSSPSASIPGKDEGEIRHIDSPILVDNPLYGVQPDELKDVNGNEETKREEEGSKGRSENKVLERCNSAPLVRTNFHLSLPESGSEEVRVTSFGSPSLENDGDSGFSGPNSKMVLCKRLSEPTLSKSTPECERSRAWKATDAKRLANRKQSVKELLCKFETQEGSPTGSGVCQGSTSPGPGLPRPEFRIGNLNRATSQTRNKSGSPGGGKFQHHRFSMGDILMSQSLSSAEELKEIKSVANSMIRSDTFPELRTEATKENKKDNSEGVEVEKVTAIRVAMSSVDMNDPSTRERIEKYKEERRMFLRQKINSELSGEKSSSESKGSVISLKSPEKEIVSSNESVFSHKTLPLSSDNISIESPRKRAFSEDVPPAYSNITKAIKTEPPKIPHKPETRPTRPETREEEEVNVREKVAMWTTNQKRANSFVDSSRKSKKEGSGGSVKVKPILKEATSLPPEGFSRSQSSIEFSPQMKGKSVRNEGGKKIKDMAAFFEAKRF